MGCEIEPEQPDDMDLVLSSMWPDCMNEVGHQFNVEKLGLADQDMLDEVTINKEPNIVDFHRLMELTNYSDKGNGQLANLVKNWEYKQENAVRLLREELVSLSKQQQAVELKKLEILEEHRFEDKRPVLVLDEDMKYLYQDLPRRKNELVFKDEKVEFDAENDTVMYWKQRALQLEKLLEASLRREEVLLQKLQESIENLERQSSPVEELSQVLKRADNFLHFVLQNAPVVIGHQDKELRYRFIFNHFPSLGEEDIIGKTDVEIFSGAGVKESHDFKREVLERGLPAKREIRFETGLFGSKTFLIYVEPVFSKTGETIGINYMGMEVTDQVSKREKMAKVREEMAVQKAKETELNKTIHITEESMRAKQMLATMSHEIRSPLSGVVSMAEILSTTSLDKEQRQLLKLMLSSGDLVLQLINDILDLSKVESGVMKLEATKFRPREVVKHVLQTAAASLQKLLTLEGHVADDVPMEVIGDVLRGFDKFSPTSSGKVGINLYVVQDPSTIAEQGSQQIARRHLAFSTSTRIDSSESQGGPNRNGNEHQNGTSKNQNLNDRAYEKEDNGPKTEERVVWIRCDVYDTGIGIPENAITTLFKKYMQVGADTARKYGGTGLGLAICKQLVELMGGHLTVSSVEHRGSTFSFVLPCNASSASETTMDELSNSDHQDILDDDLLSGEFLFPPRTIREASGRFQNDFLEPHNCDGLLLFEDPLFPTRMITCKEGVRNEKIDSAFCLSVTTPEASEAQVTACGEKRARDEEGSECSSSNSPEIPRFGSRPKILLVEDNKINVMLTKSMMKQLGHEIDVVHNGAEAVRAVQSNGYNLILMDICMPVMDGLLATRLIRSYEETGNWDEALKAGVDIQLLSPNSLSKSIQVGKTRKRTPIIAMTANALSESADECYANGMDSFVTKPITFQNLKQCLLQYLQ